MFDVDYPSTHTASRPALEVAMRARETEKKIAILVAEQRAEETARKQARRGGKSLLANLLSSLRIF